MEYKIIIIFYFIITITAFKIISYSYGQIEENESYESPRGLSIMKNSCVSIWQVSTF